MATVTPRIPFDRAATDRRVRHPLESLRGYIRTYVLLEGAAVALIYLALWFWVGLALDWGPFRLFAFDWIQELNGAVGEGTAFVFRAVLLGLLVLGLLALVAFRVVTRLVREFSDAALALVLERRFPRELGDRLITAVELADPRLADRYGFSQEMIDHTIRDAAERVERVPVRQVFNWRRLRRHGLVAFLSTVGVYLLVFLGYAGYAAATEASPGDFVGRFNNVATIWGERNVLLMNTYWPRRAYLEVLRFQDAPDHPGEMRVARDEQRPELLVRAVQWVVADHGAEGGWRPLRWNDLPQFVDADMLNVPLPADWGGWVIDLDDLDPSVPAGSVPAEWNGKASRLFHAMLRSARRHPGEATPPLKVSVKDKRGRSTGTMTLPPVRREALPAVERLLDWHNWTVDQIALQLGTPEKTEVRYPMRRDFPEAVRHFENVFTRLEELADDPGMARRLRKLEIPDEIFFYYRGKTTKSETPHERGEGNKYLVGLGELKESVKFTFRGEDYYTPSRTITLVPPPGLTGMTMDREEPAYIYWRLQGSQLPLKGKRQVFKNASVSITGEVSTIEVPLGTSLELHARADRPLQEGVRLAAPANRKVSGSVTPAARVRMDADGQGFRTGFRDVTRPIEFELQYLDTDGVKGRRHVVIEPKDDRGPQEVVPVELTVLLRKPRPAAGAGKAVSPTLDGFLVTPDAVLPFKGTFTDEYGLTDMSWKWHGEEVEFELIGRSPALKGEKGKGGGLVLGGNTQVRRAGLVVSGLQSTPPGLGGGLLAPAYWVWLDRILTYDLERSAKTVTFDAAAPLEVFGERLKERDAEAIPAAVLDSKLQGPVPKGGQLRTHSLERTEFFDFRKLLPKLKSLDPTKEAQLHYRIRLFVSARDNNVETGTTPDGTVVQNKVPITFLVVSENELMAQILLEEEVLRERLEKAVDRLKTGKTILDEQALKLGSGGADLSLVGLRTDEVRKFLLDGSGATREVSTDYNRILKEMEVNRVAEQRVNNVDTKICKPLEEALTPGTGHFAATETPVTKLWEGIEEDLARLKKAGEDGKSKDPQLLQALEARRQEHIKAASDARENMAKLIAHLEDILQSIGGELVEREVIAMLLQIERDQRTLADIWTRRYIQLRDDEINRLTNPGQP